MTVSAEQKVREAMPPSAVPTIWNQPELRIRSGLGGNYVAPL